MAIKTKRPKKLRIYKENSLEDRILATLGRLTHRELQKECVSRGMPFDEVIGKSHFHLVSFFHRNFENSQNPNLIVEFDSFIEGKLMERGYKKGDIMLSPSLRFGYTKGIENLDKIKDPEKVKVSEPKVIKPKAEVDEKTGVRKGTKKSLTYDLTLTGISIDKIIKKVKEKFPEAEEKSIKIWHKRCLKSQTK